MGHRPGHAGRLSAWAFIHCLRTRADAFPAIGRQSKGLWLALTGGATLVSLAWFSPIGILGIASIVIAAVYLLDIRPEDRRDPQRSVSRADRSAVTSVGRIHHRQDDLALGVAGLQVLQRRHRLVERVGPAHHRVQGA